MFCTLKKQGTQNHEGHTFVLGLLVAGWNGANLRACPAFDIPSQTMTQYDNSIRHKYLAHVNALENTVVYTIFDDNPYNNQYNEGLKTWKD